MNEIKDIRRNNISSTINRSDYDSSESSRTQPSKHSYQLRIDSVEEASTAPITESNSREELITRDRHEAEEYSLQKYQCSEEENVQIPRFLSVPVLRDTPAQRLEKRNIASSPAKSERMVRECPNSKVAARRLSQDSGIVAGRLCNGGDINYLDSTPIAKNDTHKTSTDNIYALLINETESKVAEKRTNSFYNVQDMQPSPAPLQENETITLPSFFNDQRPSSINCNASYNEKWRPGYNSNYYKSQSISIPLPTHVETDSAQPSPTFAFGPKIEASDIPGTTMIKELGLNLSAPPTPEPEEFLINHEILNASELDKAIIRTEKNILEEQFAYKQLEHYQKSRQNSKSSSLSSSLNDSHYNSCKQSKRNSAVEEEKGSRRISKQDREGLDSESLMFRDGRRKIDMVLAWEEEDFGVMTELESRKRDSRKIFMENLIKEGLEVELEDKTQSFNECTYFLKIHLPWRVETRLAEVMNIKLPVKRFITISVKPPWDEENIMVRNIQQWKEVWQRLTKRIQLDESLLEGEATFKAATASGNPEEQ